MASPLLSPEEEEEEGDEDDDDFGAATSKKPSDAKTMEMAILSAIRQDVDSLAMQFLQLDPADQTLDHFGRLFNEMEFSTIFFGRLTFGDLVEFSENLFHYVASFMFGPSPPNNQTLPKYVGEASPSKMAKMFPGPEERTDAERIFGIFLTYSLYFLQPSQFVIPVFITCPQLDDLSEFMSSVLLPEEDFEALYCLYRLAQSNAFAIYPFDGDFNPILYRHFNLCDVDAGEAEMGQITGMEDLERLHSLAEDSNHCLALKFNTETSFQHMNQIHQRYTEEKRRGTSFQLGQNAKAPGEVLTRLIQDTSQRLAQQRAQRERGQAVVEVAASSPSTVTMAAATSNSSQKTAKRK